MISAALPDPSQPTFVLLAAGLGAFLGATVGRLRGSEREDVRRIAENWAYCFTPASVVAYLVLLAFTIGVMRKHWMAIPIAAVTPFMVLATVLWKTEGWSNGALGTVYLGLMGIAAVVGSFMAPIERR
jgi:hypothetical protein